MLRELSTSQGREVAVGSRTLQYNNTNGLIKNPQWQCAYKLLACFGLRPHELQFIDLSEFPPVLNITDGKTGSRRIYPVPKEWLEIFELDADNISLAEVKDFGEQMSRNLASAEVPFVPYDRDCKLDCVKRKSDSKTTR
jgi:hypothetical protein